MAIIAPSLLSCNFARIEEECDFMNRSEAGWYHLDIMDGVFVPNISFGFPVIEAIAKYATKPLDAHFMTVEPQQWISKCKSIGVEYMSVHYEACNHLHRTIQQIHDSGMKAGVAINPHTSVTLLEDILSDADYILVMSVNPGFGGQKFIPHTLEKIKRLDAMRRERSLNFLIEVDGGVGPANSKEIINCGADVLVAGNAVFKAPDRYKAIEEMKF